MSSIGRRMFLGSAGASAAFALLRPSAPSAASRSLPVVSQADPQGANARVAALIALSRDAEGRVHVAQAAFLSAGSVTGTLPVSSEEFARLWGVMAARDFSSFQERGLQLGGRRFVFLRESEAGAVVHAARRGEFVTLRATGEELVVATSLEGMLPQRAVAAVYQYALRSRVVA